MKYQNIIGRVFCEDCINNKKCNFAFETLLKVSCSGYEELSLGNEEE
jgi:hypothetical protein